MKIKIKSNFIDYYDTLSSSTDGEFIWHRIAECPVIDRLNQLKLMSSVGLNVPEYGVLTGKESTSPGINSDDELIVAYLDPKLHFGAGKMLTTKSKLLRASAEAIKGMVWTKFIPTTSDPLRTSLSYRWLRIGESVYWIEHQSSDGWMSNHSISSRSRLGKILPESSVTFFSHLDLLFSSPVFTGFPLLAIDFLVSVEDEQVYCFDLSHSPRIESSCIEKMVSKEMLWSELLTYLNKNKSHILEFLFKSLTFSDRCKIGTKIDSDFPLVWLPYRTILTCVEEGSQWVHTRNEVNPLQSFYQFGGYKRLKKDSFFANRSYVVTGIDSTVGG